MRTCNSVTRRIERSLQTITWATSIEGEGNLDRIGQAKSVRCADARGLFCDGGSYRKCVEVGTVEKKLPIPNLKIFSPRDNRQHQNFAQADDRGPAFYYSGGHSIENVGY